MYCPFCFSSFDGPDDGGKRPYCAAKYNHFGEWEKRSSSAFSDNGHHERGSDAIEGDYSLFEIEDRPFAPTSKDKLLRL